MMGITGVIRVRWLPLTGGPDVACTSEERTNKVARLQGMQEHTQKPSQLAATQDVLHCIIEWQDHR